MSSSNINLFENIGTGIKIEPYTVSLKRQYSKKIFINQESYMCFMDKTNSDFKYDDKYNIDKIKY